MVGLGTLISEGDSREDSSAGTFAAWLASHHRTVLVAVLLLTLAAAALLPRLQFDADLVALLPEDSVAAADYRRFISHFGGFEKVFIVVLPASSSGGHGAVDEGLLVSTAERLTEILQQRPEVASARCGLEPADEDFLLQHVVARAPLFLPDDALPALAARLEPVEIVQRVQRLRSQMTHPMGGWQIPFMVHDPLGLSEPLELERRAGDGLPLDPLTSAFLSGDGAALVIVTPEGSEIDPASGRELQTALDEAFAEVQGELGDGVRFAAVGGPLYAVQDEAALRGDLQATVGGSVLGCVLLLLLAFGGPRYPTLIVIALGAALCWSLAAVVLFFGALSAIGVGFAAVLVGLGVDYGIHGATRLRQRRLAGDPMAVALADTFRHSGPGIVASGCTTAAAFAVLSLAHFRPLRELGIMVALGILLILVSAVWVGSTLAVWSDRAPSSGRGTALWRVLGTLVRWSVGSAQRHAGKVLLLTLLATVSAAWMARHLELSADLRALRPADHPALMAERLLVQHFDVGLDTATVVFPAPDLSTLLERSDAVSQLLRQRLPGATVTSASDWLPSPRRIETRLQRLNELPWQSAAEQLEAELRRAGLSPAAFEPGLAALRAWGRGEDLTGTIDRAWPAVAQELLRRPGQITTEVSDGDHWAAIRLRLPKGAWAEGPPRALRQELEAVAPGVGIASAVALGQDMRRLASTDFQRLGWVALVLMLLVVAVSFRGRPKASLFSLLPVVLGCCWTFGLWGATGLPLDLISLAVLPILLGIGIDDGLHSLHGAVTSKAHAAPLAESIQQAGRAMVLTTLTTAVGFASLTLSSVPGMRRGGLLISVGVFACLVATLWVLPALEAWMKMDRKKR